MTIDNASAAIARRSRWTVVATATLFAAALSACGGGGGGGDSPVPAPTPAPALPASATLANQCAPTNPLAAANLRTGSLDLERRFVRSYVDEAYLWYREVPVVDPLQAAFNNPADVPTSLDSYFNALLTLARTPSNKFKDQFSFTFATAEWNALSQSGTVGGFGIEWVLGSQTAPRNIRVAYVDPNTPAANASPAVARGFALVSVNGVSADDNTPAGISVLNEALFSARNNVQYTFVLRDNAAINRTLVLTATQVTKRPVLQTTVLNVGGARVGYIVFNDHLLPAEGQLVAAFNTLAANGGVSDLVLDLRYNGGGFIYIAAQVGYMIAGSARTTNRVFERLQFSDKRAADNNDPGNRIPFLNLTTGQAGTNTSANQALPTLNLPRVFILTGPGSCSASESIINGLKGVDVEVILIGRTTCGKPFGFTQKDNCGISYFPIEFQGINDKGFGDYADGFAPTCPAADDLARPLGDVSEGMLAAALTRRATGQCPTAAQVVARAMEGEGSTMLRHPVRDSKFKR